jgi:hypothetical protein
MNCDERQSLERILESAVVVSCADLTHGPTTELNHLLAHMLELCAVPFGNTMPYMIPYYLSGLLVKFRCTDCDWTYCVPNPCSPTVPHDEEKRAKERYLAHRCSEFSHKTAKK